MGGIPSEAVAISAVVLTYSLICLISSTLLTLLLWAYGERFTYVMIFSSFTSIATLGSFIQQIHYAVDWSIIKHAQFDQAVKSLSHPGLAFGGAAEKTDVILFYIQFFCYNAMALNILFWAVTLVIGAWNVRVNSFLIWNSHMPIVSKIFTVIFPLVTIGLMQVRPILDSVPLFFIVSNFTLLFSMLAGTVCLLLTLYKYVKTRRLVAGSRNRGAWWASGGSKGSRAPNISTPGTTQSSAAEESRRSIYDRALITRFTIGFLILLIFEVAIIVFNLVQLRTNTSLAAEGKPNLATSGAIADILFFIPGVTASLVAFLVFGTTKSWRQYWGLVTSVCGIRTMVIQRRAARREASTPDQSLEFQRLPSITRHPSEEERARTLEAENRVRIYSQLPENTNTPQLAPSIKSKLPSIHVSEVEGESSRGRDFRQQFPLPPSNSSASFRTAELHTQIPHNDLVVQREHSVEDEESGPGHQQGIFVERRYFVESSPREQRRRTAFLEDSSD